ncbi:serine--tRNA ligase [Trichonephila clavipes]|nr:serine--tRNA ligase [Trichonephila clavipes]
MKINISVSLREKRMYQEACYLMNILSSSLSQQFSWVILETLGKELERVTPFMIATNELRRVDRRGVTPQHLLYVTKKIMRLRVRDSLTVAFKHVGKNSNSTRELIESEEYINGCIENNLAFLLAIPNSTWYWSERKQDLFSMIRQRGKPTMFLTISANEIGWAGLMQLYINSRILIVYVISNDLM